MNVMMIVVIGPNDKMYIFRCFSDVKTAARISIASGLTTKLDLETSPENSGLVRIRKYRIYKILGYYVPLEIYQQHCYRPTQVSQIWNQGVLIYSLTV